MYKNANIYALGANGVKKFAYFLFLRFQAEVVLTNITTVTLTTILLQSRMNFLMLPGLETRAFDARATNFFQILFDFSS